MCSASAVGLGGCLLEVACRVGMRVATRTRAGCRTPVLRRIGAHRARGVARPPLSAPARGARRSEESSRTVRGSCRLSHRRGYEQTKDVHGTIKASHAHVHAVVHRRPSREVLGNDRGTVFRRDDQLWNATGRCDELADGIDRRAIRRVTALERIPVVGVHGPGPRPQGRGRRRDGEQDH